MEQIFWMCPLAMDVCLFLLTITSFLPSFDTAKLQISPPHNFTAGLPSFTLNCTVDSTSGIDVLFTIELKRKRPEDDEKTIGTVNEGEATPRYAPGITQPKFTLTGSLQSSSSVSSSYLLLVVSDPGCSDGATYTCVTSGFATGIATSVSDTRNVIVEENPKNLSLSTTPSDERYDPNTEVNITCTGNLISVERSWTWHWRDPNSNLWSAYPYTASTKTLSQTGVACEHVLRSTISYTVPNAGNGVLFRCSVNGDDEMSLTTSVQPKHPLTDAPEIKPDDRADEPTTTTVVSGKLAGMAVGLTFVMVLVVSVVAAVVHITCWQKRKLRVSNSENTK